MRAIGLDIGSRRIGLARSDESGQMASVWDVFHRKGDDDARDLLRMVIEADADLLVVGLPLELDGSEGRRAKLVRGFVQRLSHAIEAQELSITIETWDERFSTMAAERTLLEANVSRKQRKQKVDALAAQFFLQGWLDHRNSGVTAE